MNLKHCVMLKLMDGKGCSFGELREEIGQKIDPKRAVRCYLQTVVRGKTNPELPSLEYQVEKGKRRILRNVMFKMIDNGYLECSNEEGEVWDDSVLVKLTPEGTSCVGELVFSKTRNEVKEQVRKMWRDGKVSLVFTHNGVQN